MSSPQEFRERSRKLVTLPSGLTVKIKKIWLIDFVSTGDLPLPPSGAETAPPEPQDKVAIVKQNDVYFDRVIAAGAEEPRFTAEAGLASPDLLHTHELERADYEALGMAILAWSSATKEVKADADSFRAVSPGKNGSGPGGEVPAAADRDTESGAG